MRKTSAALCVTVGVLVAYASYIEVPEGWGDPWAVRLRLAAMRGAVNLGLLVDKLGFCSGPLFLQRLSDAIPHNVLLPGSHLEEVAHSSELTLAGVKVRLFEPKGHQVNATLLPGMIYIHGGGWAMGSVDQYDSHVRRKVRDLNVIAISIEYRRSPIHQFPTPLDDCVAATKQFLKDAAKYGVDQSRVAIVGDSAGGNLAAATCLRLRDEEFPIRPKMQILIYPVLQLLNFHSPSYASEYINSHFMPDKATMIYFYLYYTFGHSAHLDHFRRDAHAPNDVMRNLTSSLMPIDALPTDDAHFIEFEPVTYPEKSQIWDEISSVVLNPYVSPLLAPDLSNLPETYVSVCQFDVLRDDGIWYVERLKKAGVKAEYHLFDKGFHTWHLYSERFEESHENMIELTDYIKDKL